MCRVNHYASLGLGVIDTIRYNQLWIKYFYILDNQLYKVKFDCLKVTSNSTTTATTNNNNNSTTTNNNMKKKYTNNLNGVNSLIIYNYMH